MQVRDNPLARNSCRLPNSLRGSGSTIPGFDCDSHVPLCFCSLLHLPFIIYVKDTFYLWLLVCVLSTKTPLSTASQLADLQVDVNHNHMKGAQPRFVDVQVST